jgi:hypothetical protein
MIALSVCLIAILALGCIGAYTMGWHDGYKARRNEEGGRR